MSVAVAARAHDQTQDKPSIFGMSPVPHAVGFRVVDQYDYSRTYAESVDALGQPMRGERARPIQTLIWYPAEKTPEPHLILGDYLALAATEIDFTPSRAHVEAAERKAKRFTTFAGQRMWAVRRSLRKPMNATGGGIARLRAMSRPPPKHRTTNESAKLWKR